jgi:3-oxoadipate enol-lactonase
VRSEPDESETPVSRLVELPGRGTTRVWECAGPRDAETLVLIHGVTFTAELNWRRVLEPLGRHFRVVAADLRGHGEGIRAGSRFRLEDCADDVAALAGVLGVGRFTAVGYSMGGMVAQLVYRRHAALVSGLVLCSTACDVRGSLAEQLAAFAAPTMAAALQWNPVLHLVGAEIFGSVLMGGVDDPATGRWARAQLELARAVPGASVHQVDAGHGACINAPDLFARSLLEACWSVEPGRDGALSTSA